MEGTKIELTLGIYDSDGNHLRDCDNLDEAIHAACETVIDTWPDFEVATIAYEGNAPGLMVAVVKVQRGMMRGTRLARVSFPDTGLGTTVEVPVGGFPKKGRRP